MKGIQGKIMKPILWLEVLFVLCALLQVLNTRQTYSQVTDMDQTYFMAFRKADELKLSVVQVQQWLTDISATRAAEGFDDGLDEAAVYADKVRTLIEELRQLGNTNETQLNAISESFEAYYATA